MVGVNVNIWQIIYLKFMIFWQKSYLDTPKRVGPNRSTWNPGYALVNRGCLKLALQTVRAFKIALQFKIQIALCGGQNSSFKNTIE